MKFGLKEMIALGLVGGAVVASGGAAAAPLAAGAAGSAAAGGAAAGTLAGAATGAGAAAAGGSGAALAGGATAAGAGAASAAPFVAGTGAAAGTTAATTAATPAAGGFFSSPWTTAGIMAGKSQFIDKPRIEERNQAMADVAAAQTRFSPWTGNVPGQFTAEAMPDTVGEGFQGYMLGKSMDQASNRAASEKSLMDAHIGSLKSDSMGAPQFSTMDTTLQQPSMMQDPSMMPSINTSTKEMYDYVDPRKMQGRSLASSPEGFNLYAGSNYTKQY